MAGPLPADAGAVDLGTAAVRRPGTDITLIAYGGTLSKASDAAGELSSAGISAEVVDLRTLRPLDDAAIMASVRRTHRVVIVDEGWRSGGLAAELSARIWSRRSTAWMRQWSGCAAPRCQCLTRGIWRTPRCPRSRTSWPRPARRWADMAEFTMPVLGADMDEGTVLEWLVKPGDEVHKGDVIAVVDTAKSAIEVESFHTGTFERLVTPAGETVPVGTVLALIRETSPAVAGTKPSAGTAPAVTRDPALLRQQHRGHGCGAGLAARAQPKRRNVRANCPGSTAAKGHRAGRPAGICARHQRPPRPPVLASSVIRR